MAVVGWIDTDDVENEVEQLVYAGNMEWTDEQKAMVSRRTLYAYNAIVAKLVGRGYTLAQINTWIQRQEYQYDIAMCWILDKLAYKKGDEQEWTEKFCRLDELDDLNLVDESGVNIEPAEESEALGVTSFELQEINDDLDITMPS